MRTVTLGARGEAIAADWLERHGYVIVDRNWRCARGELDIVARCADDLVFVEVKTRAGASTGHPLEAVTPQKLTRLRRLVPAWFAAHPDHSARGIRIDAIAVHVMGDRSVVEHVEAVA
ncbi:YraN family protein [Curtobacterium sp. VKM Ac-1395]|uniref:YraN family protein n=1 Tax=Curtobacterium sp. VKM Ac-1395 TaxID=2783815 RepID=UPI00188C1625|nr:YraN family protein [Curtobacterium sp. VKM Ac-1395]MBF4589457.1 YraN family protein [Curtobacterium sp. VKM Ac-1395]